MIKFFKRGFLFLLPIIIVHLFTYAFYEKQKGDLLRLGFIFNRYPSYLNQFEDNLKKPIKFKKVSEFPKSNKFDVITIGDSFSEQQNFGYQNLLSDEGIEILHFDRKIHKSNHPIQTTLNLLEGDFFDNYHSKFLILEIVEREFVYPSESIQSEVLSIDKIKSILEIWKPKQVRQYVFPTDEVIKFPFYTYKYFIEGDYLFPKVMRIKTETNLFSIETKEVLVYDLDLKNVLYNNNINLLKETNEILNTLSQKLSKKGIKLIVLPAPDKFDFYFEYISKPDNYKKPIFFDLLTTLKKDYFYINSKEILKKSTNKDIYFYDDTHWSPKASKLIAVELKKIIND